MKVGVFGSVIGGFQGLKSIFMPEVSTILILTRPRNKFMVCTVSNIRIITGIFLVSGYQGAMHQS